MHLVPLEEYCRRLRSDPQRGLSSVEAKLRLDREGPNLLVQRRRVTELLKFLRQLTNLFAMPSPSSNSPLAARFRHGKPKPLVADILHLDQVE